MKTFMKKVLVVLLSVTMLIPAAVSVSAATTVSSPSLTDISNAKVRAYVLTYTGKTRTAKLKVRDAAGNLLVKGVDYTLVSGKGKKAGKYEYTIKGIGKYTGTYSGTFYIRKTQKVTVSGAKSTVKYSTLKSKKVSFKLKTTVKGKAEISYTTSNSKYVKVSSSGKVVVKKGTPKGTYKIKVYASATNKYKEGYKVITVTVK